MRSSSITPRSETWITSYILASQLIDSCPHPDATEDTIRIRNYAGYAFYRIGHLEQAETILEASYHFTMSHRLSSEALYQSALRTDVALQRGDSEQADLWFARSEKAARGASPHQLNPNSGFYGNAGTLAMRQGRYDEAERLIRVPQQHL